MKKNMHFCTRVGHARVSVSIDDKRNAGGQLCVHRGAAFKGIFGTAQSEGKKKRKKKKKETQQKKVNCIYGGDEQETIKTKVNYRASKKDD